MFHGRAYTHHEVYFSWLSVFLEGLFILFFKVFVFADKSISVVLTEQARLHTCDMQIRVGELNESKASLLP